MSLTIQQALARATALRAVSDSYQLDTELLLAEALQTSREYVRTWPERVMEPAAAQAFEALLARRAMGEPLAYILGRKAFWDFQLQVNPHVLIPRPETELLVETALALVRQGLCQAGHLVDLGTGSGAIAIALARELPDSRITAVDSSTEALAVARQNAARLALGNIAFQAGSWCEGLLPESVDLLVANPPYVAPGDPHLAQGDLRFEPIQALVAANAGLGDIRAIVAQARSVLRRHSWLLIEHGFDQGADVATIFSENGFAQVAGKQDYAGHDRITLGQLEEK